MDLKWLPVAFLLIFAGCADLQIEPTQEDTTPTEDEAPAQSHPTPPAQEPQRTPVKPDPHGEPEYTWGEISEGREGNKYTASRPVRVTNGLGDAARIDFTMIADYANVVLVPANVGSYVYDFDLTVRSNDADTARSSLEEVDLRHTDMLVGDTLTLSSDPSFGPVQLVNVNINGQGPQRSLSFDVVVQVPYHLVYDLLLDGDYSDIAGGALAVESLDIILDYSDVVLTAPRDLDMIRIDADYSDVVLTAAEMPEGTIDIDLDYSDVVLSFADVAPMRIEADQDYSDIRVLLSGVELIDDDEDEPVWEHEAYDSAGRKVLTTLNIDYSDVVLR